MRNIITKKKMFTFQNEKNNQTLSNDWPTYCHTGILLDEIPCIRDIKYMWKGNGCWLHRYKHNNKSNFIFSDKTTNRIYFINLYTMVWFIVSYLGELPVLGSTKYISQFAVNRKKFRFSDKKNNCTINFCN